MTWRCSGCGRDFDRWRRHQTLCAACIARRVDARLLKRAERLERRHRALIENARDRREP